MFVDIAAKNPSTLKEKLDALPANEKGPAFESVLAELYRGNGWVVTVQGGRADVGADILLSHPKTPHTVSLIVQAKNHDRPLTKDQTRIELIKFEQEAAPRYKCQQFRIVAVNGYVANARKYGAFNLLLDSWDHVEALLKSYSPDKKRLPAIDLFAHNRDAYEEVNRRWQEINQVAVVQATGTGKSFVIAKIMSDFHGKRKIVLAPSHYILDQQKGRAPWLNDKATYWTYASLARRSESEIKTLKCSLIVLDEFHRCGADIWGKGVQALLDTHPDAKVLGTSATPIRYLDASRDMAEELFDGVVAADLSLAEAIVRRILPAPTYISALYTLEEEIKELVVEINASKRNDGEKAKFLAEVEKIRIDWEKTSGVPEILKKRLPKDINKIIVFCKDQAHLDRMEVEVQKWFQKAGTHKFREKYRILSADPTSKKNLDRFKEAHSKDTVHILFAIDMMNEGLHIPEVGAVVLLRPTESPTVFYQQIGRCIEVGRDRTPIIFDLVNNFQSIRASDFINDLQKAAAEEEKKREENDLERNTPAFRIDALTRKIEDIFNDIREKLTPWESQFEALLAFKAREGHCNVPKDYPSNPSLSLWVNTQRRTWRQLKDKSDLPERFRMLEAQGFVWDPHAAKWEEMFEALLAFKAQEGHCIVPTKYPPNPALGIWVSNQRTVWKSLKDISNLPERFRKLEAEGFIWDSNAAKWEEMFKALLSFKAQEGHCNVPKRYPPNPALSIWVQGQKSEWKKLKDKRNLSNRFRRLEAEGIIWDRLSANWEEMFAALLAFKAQEGHCNVPAKYPPNPALGTWVRNQRKAWKDFEGKSTLPERLRRLEAEGFIWDQLSANWEEMFAALLAFKAQEGHCNVPAKYPPNPALGTWISNQRASWKRLKDKSNLPERLRKLEAEGFIWDSYAAKWEEMFKALLAFKAQEGHCNVPRHYSSHPALGMWAHHQREHGKDLEDKSNVPEHFRRLEAEGFIWDSYAAKWEEMFKALRAFKAQEGHCNVPRHYPPNRTLGSWVHTQRKAYKVLKDKNNLPERLRRLEAEGFVWNLKKTEG